MNASNTDTKPKVRKESKNKIKVDFERTSFKERFKAKFLTLNFFKKFMWKLIRYILLIGVAYLILFPFFSKIAVSVMATDDFKDSMVRLIPKNFSLDIYKELFVERDYMSAFGDSLKLSLLTAVLQTFTCAFVAYGFAKFKFKGNKLLFLMVILTMIIPHRTIMSSMSNKFHSFDIGGLLSFFSGGEMSFFGLTYNSPIDIIPDSWGWENGINMLDSYWPFVLLSITGLAFKNGLFIFLLRQFFMGIPDELEESAYIDGSGVFNTFFKIILPISIPMLITVFVFSFSWCWTDTFYTTTEGFWKGNATSNDPSIANFYSPGGGGFLLTREVIQTELPKTLQASTVGLESHSLEWNAAVHGTSGLMVIFPLVIIYLFCQKYLVQGIERSGLTAD